MKEQRENAGVLPKNKDKEEGSRQPDYKGAANIAGTHYWVSAWIKQGEGAFLSLSFTRKDAKPARRVDTRATFGDKIPF